jgi:hypothetical protein
MAHIGHFVRHDQVVLDVDGGLHVVALSATRRHGNGSRDDSAAHRQVVKAQRDPLVRREHGKCRRIVVIRIKER